MLISEAAQLKITLGQLAERYCQPTLVNLGSQSENFRSVQQPWVGQLFTYLNQTYTRVLHADIQNGPGIDLSLDLMDEESLNVALQAGQIFLASNLLEHLENPHQFLSQIRSSVHGVGKTFVFSGPSIFPFHGDPIDNMTRPKTEQEVMELLEGFEVSMVTFVLERHFLRSTQMKWGLLGPLATSMHLAIRLFQCALTASVNPLLGWTIPVRAFIAVAELK